MLDTIYMIEEEMDDFCKIKPLDLFMLEADMTQNNNAKPQYQANQGVMTNVVKFLQYLITQAKNIITNILSSLKSTVDYIFLSPEKKEMYEKYCNYVHSHPEAANKKITVKDWKHVDAGYNNALKRADALATKVASKQISKEDAQAEENSIFNDLSSLAGKAAAVVTIDVALRYAKESAGNAKKVMTFLNYQPGLLDQMEKELGSKEMAGFTDKVAKMTRETYFSRIKSQILYKKQKTLADIVNDIIGETSKVINADGIIDKATATASFVKNNSGAVAVAGKNFIRDKNTRRQIKTVGDLKDTATSYKNMVNELKNLFTNNANL